MIKKVFDFLGGGILGGVKELSEVFFGNRSNRESAEARRVEAVHGQFAAEFNTRLNRTIWDSLVDGLNRLPRPIFVALIIYYFWLAYADPTEFQIMNLALDTVPETMWWVLSSIIAFYFAARELKYSREKKMSLSKKEFNEQQRRVKELRASQPPTFEEEMKNTDKPLSLDAIKTWNKRRKGL
ncbi:holin family protein [Kiloniella sp.]|uniref:holin family protein n=1 Tax=Kiloniella sp. TaxID=1938587 RepID=UPI003B016516